MDCITAFWSTLQKSMPHIIFEASLDHSFKMSYVRGYSFITYPKFSEKLLFLTP